MKLLAISEHYYPRVGGTVNYVHETLCALTALGVEAELLVPGPAPEGWLPQGMAEPPYTVTWIDAGYPAKGDPSREQRYSFCRQVNDLAAARVAGPDRPDVLHVLFGLFVMEVLETEKLRAAGLPCLSTVHNVPPMECRQTAHNRAAACPAEGRVAAEGRGPEEPHPAAQEPLRFACCPVGAGEGISGTGGQGSGHGDRSRPDL